MSDFEVLVTESPQLAVEVVEVGPPQVLIVSIPGSSGAPYSPGIASIDGVSNANGNVDLVAGANMTITPDDAANSITFEATAGAGGGAPSGPAGGVLSGTYPNPGFATDMATQAEFNAHANNTSNPHGVTAAQAGAPPTSRTIGTTAPLSGGGDLSANRTLSVSAASDTAQGVVELATSAETTTGTDTTRATTPAGVKAVADTKSDTGHSHNGLAPTGGTTGQVLKKTSNTNYDYSWQADEVGAGGGGYTTIAEDGTDLTARTKLNFGANIAAADNAGSSRTDVSVADSSETAKGVVELATSAETTTGTDATRAVHPAGVKAVADTKAPTSRTINTTAPLSGGGDLSADRTLTVGVSSETATGVVELATAAEATTGTDNTRAVHPAGLKAVADTKINTSEKAAANGVATLDGGTKIPVAQIPDTVVGAMDYQGTWNASTNTPTLDNSGTGRTKGDYYKVSVAGTTSLSSITDWQIGDWVVWNGAAWDKIDNTDAVSSVFGRSGAIVAVSGDYNASQITNTPAGNISSTNLQAVVNELDTEKPPATRTINTTAPLSGGGDLSANRTIGVASASSTAEGVVELATSAETTTGTDTVRATTPAGVKAVSDLLTPQTRTISTTAPLTGGGDLSANRTLAVSAASDTAAGVVELATSAETTTGTDTTRATTPAGVKAVADTKQDITTNYRYESITVTFKGTLPTANATTSGTLRIPIPSGVTATIVNVVGTINVNPTGAGSSQTLDIRRSGTSIYSSAAKISFVPSGSQFQSGATPDTTSLTGGTHYLTVDLITAGSPSAGGSDVVLVIRYRY